MSKDRKILNSETMLVDCDCGMPEHVLKFDLDQYESWCPGNTIVEMQIGITMIQRRHFWTRLWIAARYLFRRDCGIYTFITHDVATVLKIRDFCNRFVELKKGQR